MRKQSLALLLTTAGALLASQVLASGDEVTVQELKRQLDALQARVTAIETRQSFAGFMPDLAERFHVMHRASEAGDWAVTSHELAELERLSALSLSIDKEKGKLMQRMMGPRFEELAEAIEHTDHDAFATALTRTRDTCNACHAATGSEFIQVTLDASEALSMRHPHRFMQRGAPEDHSHAMPAGGHGGMMGAPAADKRGHDDAGAAPHKH